MTLQSQNLNKAKELLAALTQKIPQTFHDSERQTVINREVVSKVRYEQRMILKDFLDDVLMQMRKFGASDIEFGGYGCNHEVWLRLNGLKYPIKEFGQYRSDEFNILILNALTPSQREFLLEKRSFDFSYTITDSDGNKFRYRACAYFELHDLALNMRAINSEIRPYESYGFHPYVTKILNLVHTKEGLVLITGITGSGKSTTLDAIIDLNNRSIEGHVVVISRPIEYIHRSQRCMIRHREVGMDTSSFKNGTIEALRQDPDVIIIGEMRDSDTIMSALEAADSGHKVFSTLHTYSSVESIDRIIGEVPSEEQARIRHRLADILRCVVSQRLIPGLCKELVLAKEIMVMTPSINAAIKNNNTSEIYQMISEGGKYGMTTLEQDLRQLYWEKKISLDTAFNYANNKRRMKQLLEIN